MNRILNRGLIKLVIFLLILSTPVYGTDDYEDINIVENSIIKPNFTYINIFTNAFDISANGKASVSSYLTARNIDNLIIKVDLQQLKDGKWTTIKSWTEPSKGINGGLSGSYYVLKGYIYRAVSKAMLYRNGVLVESTSNISRMEVY